MRTIWRNNYLFIILACCWIFLLHVIYTFSFKVQLHPGFLGPEPWANFDGANYLLISTRGYGAYQQAYFPFFPLVIYFVRFILGTRILAAYIVVYMALFLNIIAFISLAKLDYPKKTVLWSLLFLLVFPTSFFFAAIYTESLFLALVFASFYTMRKKWVLLAFLLAACASATRVVGIFLVPALLIEYFISEKKFSLMKIIKAALLSIVGSSGLIGYMIFLWQKYHDPLLFIHVQSAFGANRSTGSIVLLPQVIVRYIKIFMTVSANTFNFWIAALEITSFTFVCVLLLVFWKKVRLSYLVFSLLAIILPTLTGTFSSIPRYVLVAFPIFFILGEIKSNILKTILALVFAILLSILMALFLRGYFIA